MTFRFILHKIEHLVIETHRIMAHDAQDCGLLIFANAKGQKSLIYLLTIMLLLLAIKLKLYTCRGLINR